MYSVKMQQIFFKEFKKLNFYFQLYIVAYMYVYMLPTYMKLI